MLLPFSSLLHSGVVVVPQLLHLRPPAVSSSGAGPAATAPEAGLPATDSAPPFLLWDAAVLSGFAVVVVVAVVAAFVAAADEVASSSAEAVAIGDVESLSALAWP